MSIQSIFRRVVGEDMSLLGFERDARKCVLIRRFGPWIEQRVELVSSRSRSGGKDWTLLLGTSVDSFRGSSGLYGPGLDWIFTMNAIVGDPQIACELEHVEACSDQQIEQWLERFHTVNA